MVTGDFKPLLTGVVKRVFSCSKQQRSKAVRKIYENLSILEKRGFPKRSSISIEKQE